MQIAVYGGSFNPPHVGHGMVASWLYWTGLVQEVWLMPSFSHPFSKDLKSFETRLEWCQAFASDVGPWVRVSDIERSLPSPSYSIDSLRALCERHPKHHFRFVMGADVLPDFPKWKEWAHIEREFNPIVVGRDGYDNPKGTVVFPGISSSDIRKLLSKNSDVSHLVTRSVEPLLGEFRPI